MTDRQTDGQIDRQTDGWTEPFIELHGLEQSNFQCSRGHIRVQRDKKCQPYVSFYQIQISNLKIHPNLKNKSSLYTLVSNWKFVLHNFIM